MVGEWWGVGVGGVRVVCCVLWVCVCMCAVVWVDLYSKSSSSYLSLYSISFDMAGREAREDVECYGVLVEVLRRGNEGRVDC